MVVLEVSAPHPVLLKFVLSRFPTADIGGILYGKYMRSMILFSIVMSQVGRAPSPRLEFTCSSHFLKQIGFVAAYTIFVASHSLPDSSN